MIADEPTAALDPVQAEQTVELLVDLAEALDVTLLMATHAQALARHMGFTLVPLQVAANDDRSTTVTVAHGKA